MSEVIDIQLNEEQKLFMEKCESKFSNRYTEDDADFMELFNKDISSPPIDKVWSDKSRGGRDRRRDNYYNRSHHSRDDHYSSRDRSYNSYGDQRHDSSRDNRKRSYNDHGDHGYDRYKRRRY